MKPKKVLDVRYKILDHLSSLPKRMLSLHGLDNITEFVMHDLCGACGFNLDKAAYFVDNPDFDCLKGVVGYDKNETFGDSCSIWDNPHEFSRYMESAAFNKKVRSFIKSSLRRQGETDQEIVQEIARDLGFDNPGFFSWDMKHGNHGLFIYQKHDGLEEVDSLHEGLCYLGFCPVF